MVQEFEKKLSFLFLRFLLHKENIVLSICRFWGKYFVESFYMLHQQFALLLKIIRNLGSLISLMLELQKQLRFDSFLIKININSENCFILLNFWIFYKVSDCLSNVFDLFGYNRKIRLGNYFQRQRFRFVNRSRCLKSFHLLHF